LNRPEREDYEKRPLLPHKRCHRVIALKLLDPKYRSSDLGCKGRSFQRNNGADIRKEKDILLG
jgi:hypothetical protein